MTTRGRERAGNHSDGGCSVCSDHDGGRPGPGVPRDEGERRAGLQPSGVNVQLEGWDPQGRCRQQQRCPLQPGFSLQNSDGREASSDSPGPEPPLKGHNQELVGGEPQAHFFPCLLAPRERASLLSGPFQKDTEPSCSPGGPSGPFQAAGPPLGSGSGVWSPDTVSRPDSRACSPCRRAQSL